ncbi:MAG: Gfo/Idh/MocA family protein [Anaerolineae bacterium]|jgi:UDP-N-acetylglucosamine 3-dehydrogenase|nr:Gfo/Idh/MocA family oxidoreductase [Chloroflexota bacterium]
MEPLRAGIIGCGRSRASGMATGAGISHRHAQAYNASPDVRLVALADIVLENAQAFQEIHGGDRLYTDFHEMLAKERLDIVSVCVWPHLHAPISIDCAKARVPAIHCEKPMAPTFGEAKAMVAVADEYGVQLTINHQRRFGSPFRKAKELLDSGAIGELVRYEASCSNMYDWGTHWFDMGFFYLDQTPVEWVMAQVDPREGRKHFGVFMEGQGICQYGFANGVTGLLVTGRNTRWGAENRLIGSSGVIEVGVSPEVPLRYRTDTSGWQVVPVEDGIHDDSHFTRAIQDAAEALRDKREPELAARKALMTAEVIFATYESSRRRGRVELPLDVDDNPLWSMVQDPDTGGVYKGLEIA